MAFLSSKRNQSFIFICALLAGIVIRFYHLPEKSLVFLDEVQYALEGAFVKSSVQLALSLASGGAGAVSVSNLINEVEGIPIINKPLHSIIIGVLQLLTGTNEISVLLPSAVSAVLILVILFMLIKKIFTPGIALLFLVLASLSPLHIHYSRCGYPEMTSFLFLVCALWLYSTVLIRNSGSYILRYVVGLAAGLSLLCHFRWVIVYVTAFFIFKCFELWYTHTRPGNPLFRFAMVAAGVVAVSISPAIGAVWFIIFFIVLFFRLRIPWPVTIERAKRLIVIYLGVFTPICLYEVPHYMLLLLAKRQEIISPMNTYFENLLLIWQKTTHSAGASKFNHPLIFFQFLFRYENFMAPFLWIAGLGIMIKKYFHSRTVRLLLSFTVVHLVFYTFYYYEIPRIFSLSYHLAPLFYALAIMTGLQRLGSQKKTVFAGSIFCVILILINGINISKNEAFSGQGFRRAVQYINAQGTDRFMCPSSKTILPSGKLKQPFSHMLRLPDLGTDRGRDVRYYIWSWEVLFADEWFDNFNRVKPYLHQVEKFDYSYTLYPLLLEEYNADWKGFDYPQFRRRLADLPDKDTLIVYEIRNAPAGLFPPPQDSE